MLMQIRELVLQLCTVQLASPSIRLVVPVLHMMLIWYNQLDQGSCKLDSAEVEYKLP